MKQSLFVKLVHFFLRLRALHAEKNYIYKNKFRRIGQTLLSFQVSIVKKTIKKLFGSNQNKIGLWDKILRRGCQNFLLLVQRTFLSFFKKWTCSLWIGKIRRKKVTYWEIDFPFVFFYDATKKPVGYENIRKCKLDGSVKKHSVCKTSSSHHSPFGLQNFSPVCVIFHSVLHKKSNIVSMDVKYLGTFKTENSCHCIITLFYWITMISIQNILYEIEKR